MTIRILPDTNIIAYVFAAASRNTCYQVRALLARGLIAGLGNTSIVLVIYEEQLEEIRRALDDLLIRGVLSSAEKQNIVEEIHRDFSQLIDACKAVRRCVIAQRKPVYVSRAAALYRLLEQRKGRNWVRRLGRLSMDLKLLAVAEDYSAAVLTHDQNLHHIYREVLRDRVNIPSIYYLDRGGRSVRYKVCGKIVPFLERLLDRAAGAVGVRREATIQVC